MRQKSSHHPEGPRRQPDAAQIPGNALCRETPAEHGRNGEVVGIGRNFCTPRQKSNNRRGGREIVTWTFSRISPNKNTTYCSVKIYFD